MYWTIRLPCRVYIMHLRRSICNGSSLEGRPRARCVILTHIMALLTPTVRACGTQLHVLPHACRVLHTSFYSGVLWLLMCLRPRCFCAHQPCDGAVCYLVGLSDSTLNMATGGIATEQVDRGRWRVVISGRTVDVKPINIITRLQPSIERVALHVGLPITLVGLQDKALQGLEGTIVGPQDSKTGRWVVSVVSLPHTLAVKSGNMNVSLSSKAHAHMSQLNNGNLEGQQRVLAQRGVTSFNVCANDACTSVGKLKCNACKVNKCTLTHACPKCHDTVPRDTMLVACKPKDII